MSGRVVARRALSDAYGEICCIIIEAFKIVELPIGGEWSEDVR